MLGTIWEVLCTLCSGFFGRKRLQVVFLPSQEIAVISFSSSPSEISSVARLRFSGANKLTGRQPSPFGTMAIIKRVKIINPSPHDITYFDLKAVSQDNKIKYGLLTTENMRKVSHEVTPSVTVEDKIEDKNYVFHKDIPESISGILKKDSTTYFDLIVYPTEFSGDFPDEVVITFQALIKNYEWLKDPYAELGNKGFQWYGTVCLVKTQVEQARKNIEDERRENMREWLAKRYSEELGCHREEKKL